MTRSSAAPRSTRTLYLNQQDERGGLDGPFEKRAGANDKDFGNGQGV